MVLPPSSAAEGQARTQWLSEIRRWLHLGRSGTIVMIRDAKLPQLRPLLRMMDSVDPGVVVTLDAEDLLECEPGALVLLLVREEQLKWLNLNRPVFAQRSLRVVLWVDELLLGLLKFDSPDLHDWISHFVVCPPGVPQFAVEGLRIGMQWWPGVTWHGPGLDEALALLEINTVEVLANTSIESIEADIAGTPDIPLRWHGVRSKKDLWTVRWALARMRHTGFSVLDNPSVSAPGWFPVDAGQPDHTRLAAWLKEHPRQQLRSFIEAELEPAHIAQLASTKGPRSDDQRRSELEDVALLRRSGPLLRERFASSEVVSRRHALISKIRAHPADSWSSRVVAIFASLERDSPDWPELCGIARKLYALEHFFRFAEPDQEVPESLEGVIRYFGNNDLWGWMPAQMWPPGSVSLDDVTPRSVIELGTSVGWDVPRIGLEAGHVATTLLDEPAELTRFVHRVKSAALVDLDPSDPAFVRLLWLESIAIALAGDISAGRSQLETLPRHQHGGDLNSVALDIAAMNVLDSNYSYAAQFLEHCLPQDPRALRLYIAALMAMGEPDRASAELLRVTGRPQSPRDFLGQGTRPHAVAREYLLQRLRAFT